MAKADLTKTLEMIIKKISSGTDKNKDIYRNLVSDKKVHKIHLSVTEMTEQVEKEMYFREGIKKHGKTEDENKLTGGKHSKKAIESLDKIIARESKKLVNAFYKKFKDSKGTKYYASQMEGTKDNFTFLYAVIPGSEAERGGEFNVFKNFKTIKQTLQKPMIRNLNRWAKVASQRDETKVDRKNKKGEDVMVSKEIKAQGAGFLDIGHMEGSAVSEQKALEASEMLWELDADYGSNPVALKFLNSIKEELKWFINKVDAKGKLTDQVSVGMESKAFNRDVKSKEEAKKLEASLTDLLAKLGADFWADHGGSDSMRAKIEKTVLNQLHKSVKGGKGIKTNFRHQKIKYSDAKHKGKPIRAKVTKAALAVSQRRTVKKPKRVKAKKAGPSNVPLYLIGVINKDLPNVVEGNMGPPRLTSQTGRFAGSTRVTDMIQTSKGFPSIGYTYQRDPYGVFEQDSDYDPRKLIDKSIREIAAEYAIGRFYTRRV